MDESFRAILRDWDTFFTLTATAAATLVGLQFVAFSLAVTLLKSTNYREEIAIYVTPTVYHFGFALLISLAVFMPTLATWIFFLLLALLCVMGCLGLVPALRTLRRSNPGSRLDFDTWLWYCIIPLADYILLLVAAVLTFIDNASSIDILASAVLILLTMGIRNCWNFTLWIARHRTSDN